MDEGTAAAEAEHGSPTACANATPTVDTRVIDGHEIRIVNGHAELPAGMKSVPEKAFHNWDPER